MVEQKAQEESDEEEEKPQPQKRKQNDKKVEEQPNKKEPKVDKNLNSKLLKNLPQNIRSSIVEKFPYSIGDGIRYRELNKDKSEIDIASKTVKNGSKVTIKYTCRTYKNNAILDKGNGFKFTVGKLDVIGGLDKGVKGLKRGSIRQLLIDPSEAYPDKGVLIFTFEVTNVE